MKLKIIWFLACFILFGCGASKKTKETTESQKISEKTEKTEEKTETKETKTAPSNNKIAFDVNSLADMVGDFMQEIESGNGNKSRIEKKGDQIIITNENAGSSEKETSTTKTTEKTVYNAEFVITEVKTVIKRIPFKFWLLIILLIIIIFRKFLTQIITAAFPGVQGYRLVKMFLGVKENK